MEASPQMWAHTLLTSVREMLDKFERQVVVPIGAQFGFVSKRSSARVYGKSFRVIRSILVP
jgi:hypothetical protein